MTEFSNIQKLNAMTGMRLEVCEKALCCSNGNINDALRLLRTQSECMFYIDTKKE